MKTLSDKIVDDAGFNFISQKAVEWFIKQLKEKSFSNGCRCNYCEKNNRHRVVDLKDILKLAGDKLI